MTDDKPASPLLAKCKPPPRETRTEYPCACPGATDALLYLGKICLKGSRPGTKHHEK